MFNKKCKHSWKPLGEAQMVVKRKVDPFESDAGDGRKVRTVHSQEKKIIRPGYCELCGYMMVRIEKK